MGKFVGLTGLAMSVYNLERDLVANEAIREAVQTDRTFANELYAALCNNQFIHVRMGDHENDYWSCTWRYAGEIVAHIESLGGDYMDYYCTGNEGTISPRVESALAAIGWSGRPWPKDD